MPGARQSIRPPLPGVLAGALFAALFAVAPHAEARQLEGTPFRDYIQGTARADLIVLGAGADRGFGRRGGDRVHGGPGRDVLRGGPGRDLLRGGPGADVLDSRDGRRDRLVAGGGGPDICMLDGADLRRARGCERIALGSGPLSAAYGIWQPGRGDSCPRWLHDSFSAFGADGLLYPSWHPPRARNPLTGRRCRFGHEHGRAPAGSHLFRWIRSSLARRLGGAAAAVPFGAANEALDRYSAAGAELALRHEDHVGHKIEWRNDAELERALPGGGREPLGVHCDYLTKIHQGSHSHDALGNNVHELIYAARCDDGTTLLATTLAAFGAANEFTRSCDPAVVVPAGTTHSYPQGPGARLIPDRSCIEEHVLVPQGESSDYERGLYETWEVTGEIRTPSGQVLARYEPSFAVLDPSRFAAEPGTGVIGRTIGACYATEAGTAERARGGYCERARAYAFALPWDDPRSVFSGVRREVRVEATELVNDGGPELWHTDPYGGSASPFAFPGSIPQRIGGLDNRRPFDLAPRTLRPPVERGGGGVHAPN